MRLVHARNTVAAAFFAIFLPAAASAQVSVVFGTSWDPPANSLQATLDARYGAGNINVLTDYIGHDAGDPDPFLWNDLQFDALLVREVSGNASNNLIGWYKETGSAPTIDGSDDGVVFNGPASDGAVQVIFFAQTTPFGFYMNPNGTDGATNAPEPELFFTTRQYNDAGPSGAGAIHSPIGGDVQALVFDVSAWTSPNTWVVCFEDLDSGADPSPCCATTDNDFNDFVFEVHAVGSTPAVATSIGRIKAMYR
jgi:hypothetical protein